ncbi:hypothetical protein GGX14DRAFT_576298 [Mycena pura]|uniref:Uncharacterized protein n=1 Tax=Mycena pura TaxID=153505 RepID=A0AAD6UUF4_9AGAR|nr:hypothetical protein GGX14DRAFT_576298 [Mycena pura]
MLPTLADRSCCGQTSRGSSRPRLRHLREYDSSPDGYRQFQRTQQRIAHWTEDTAHAAHQFKSPFLPRSDVQDNDTRRSHPSHGHNGHGHGRIPERSHLSGAVQRVLAPFARSPLRSHTIAVSPDNSISQVASRHARLHSPTGRAQEQNIGAGVQLVHVQPPQPQPAAYIVYPGNRKVHIVYPERAHGVPAPQHHGSLPTHTASEAAAAAARAALAPD